MKKSQILIVTFSIAFGLGSFVMWLLFMIMAEDLNHKISKQQEYIKELEWENENNYMYCEVTQNE